MEEEMMPLVPTSHKLMPLWEIFTFLRACKFNPKEEVCYISQTKGYMIISKKMIADEDWKTQIAKEYENIPSGAVVDFEGIMQNFYGRYAKVRYNGILYYVREADIEYRQD